MMNEEFNLIAIGVGTQPFAELSRRQRKRLTRFCRRLRFSANLVVDLGQTCDYPTTLMTISGQSTVVGRIVDLQHADTNCQLWVAGGNLSGILPVLIQTSDLTTSGSFTDPTSGLPTGSFPIGGFIASGGVFWCNSGLFASGNQSPAASVADAPLLASGGIVFASFQRPHRYARLIITSGTAAIGAFAGAAGFVSQKRTVGSGGGFTFSPGSGSVSV